jgi:hypothetical protein
MSRRDKLSRDQKRKRKLAERVKNEPVQAYTGSKYKSEKYVEALMKAEVGIYESYVITERQLTDWDVKKSLEYLIRELRGEKPKPTDGLQAKNEAGESEDVTAWRIKDQWKQLFADQPRHSNADLAGVLRTILGSVELRSRPTPDSRGYLHYLEGFLGQMGVNVELLNPKNEPGEEDPSASANEDELMKLGDAWLASRDPSAKRAFEAKVNELMAERQPGVVVEVCQNLIGKATHDGVMVKELESILKGAWKQEPPTPSPNPLSQWLRKIGPRWLRR